MPHQVSYEETNFLAKMGVPPLEMEPLAKQCTQVTIVVAMHIGGKISQAFQKEKKDYFPHHCQIILI